MIRFLIVVFALGDLLLLTACRTNPSNQTGRGRPVLLPPLPFERHRRYEFSSAELEEVKQSIIAATNRERARRRMGVLRRLPGLDEAAQGHANDMARWGFFSHTSPVRGKRKTRDRLELAGVPDAMTGGENIATRVALVYLPNRPVFSPSQTGRGFSYSLKGPSLPRYTPGAYGRMLVRGWMDSPPHRKNLLEPRYDFVGVGLCVNPHSADQMPIYSVVQNFSARLE